MTQPETLPCPNPECDGKCGVKGSRPPTMFITCYRQDSRSPDKPEAEAVRNPLDAEREQWLRDDLRAAGCKCPKSLLGHIPGKGPRCRLCNTYAYALPSDKLRRLVAEWRKISIIEQPNESLVSKGWRDACFAHANQVEALLSHEPSSGEAQKPVAWLNTKGDARQVVIAERMSPELSRELSEAEWTSVPLFASPVTDGGKK